MTSRVKHTDDSGAALVLALVVITVVAVVIAAVLSFADTSIRSTLHLRDQAAKAAAADGAAKIAINKLQQGNYSGTGNCFEALDKLDLGSFYQPPSGSAYSATVKCTKDENKSSASPVVINAANKPGSAILTLGTTGDGLNIKVSGGGTIKVHGGIFSNSNITISQGVLSTNTSVTARGNCTGSITSAPARKCNIGTAADPRGNDPNYPAPTTTPTPPTFPTCSGNNKVIDFRPGLYADLAKLNKMTDGSSCKNSIYVFHPGTYYFNFGGEWLIDSGYLIGGTPTTNPVGGTPPTIPGSCKTPIPPNPPPPGGWTKPDDNAGVQFVFGGDSRIRVKAAQVEICGTYSKTSPPIAVYGLKTAVESVPAQSGCITASGCAVIKTDNSPNSKLYIQGTTYVPKAAVDISLNNATAQVFRYGVIARSLAISATGSFDLSSALIEVPDDSPGFGMRPVVNLKVYICSGAAPCSTDGDPNLKATVGLSDQSGKREATVYSWSVQR
ncbi:hypothetical protein ABT297_07710 [Dactylosporangium sp. NPDC000555]|uniref:hypothetical protein n=1 Tax=Dactylosporangium sp. NPDC000555 TaxID=3154260 RepID=UPI003331ADF7